MATIDRDEQIYHLEGAVLHLARAVQRLAQAQAVDARGAALSSSPPVEAPQVENLLDGARDALAKALDELDAMHHG